MLLSCLVDADRLDTAGRANLQVPLLANVKLEQLNSYLSKLRDQAPASGTSKTVDDVRTEVQELCRTAAQGAAHLLSLAVPTGGGKTLAAMRFALERALASQSNFDASSWLFLICPSSSRTQRFTAQYSAETRSSNTIQGPSMRSAPKRAWSRHRAFPGA